MMKSSDILQGSAPLLRLRLTVAFWSALMVPVGIALAALSGIGHRWVDILAQFTGPALVLAFAALAVAAVARDRALLAGAVTATALVLAAGAPQWSPPRGEPAPGSPTFTLYAANLHIENTDVEAVRRSISRENADVVILIEVGPAQTRALDRILADYPHRVIQGRNDQALTSRPTIIAGRQPLSEIDLGFDPAQTVSAVAQTPIGPVTLAAVHLTRPWPYRVQWEQIRQTEQLIRGLRAVSGPVVAAGDFNSVASARIGRLIRSETGMVPAPGWPGTWPTWLPSFAGITIDQAYRSPDLALVDRRLGRPTGSDHRPIITRYVRAVSVSAP